jgi:hypothetical protein
LCCHRETRGEIEIEIEIEIEREREREREGRGRGRGREGKLEKETAGEQLQSHFVTSGHPPDQLTEAMREAR